MYRLAIRSNFSTLHYSGKLFQQFLVDSYVKVEGQHLQFIRDNQTVLRAESYSGLQDFLENAAENENLQPGKIIVLPSTFSGSPRQMQQLFLGAMSIVGKKGGPDIFLTFTSNPSCSLIHR